MAGPRKKSALKGKGGVIAVGILVALGGWLALDLKKPVSDPDAPKVAESVDIRADDVSRVEVKRPGGGFTLAKQGGQWAFEAPGRYAANPETVNSWLKGLLDDAAVSQRVDGGGGDLAKFGLDKPQVELLLTAGGRQRAIQVGKDFRTPGQKQGTLFYARETGAGRMFMLSTAQVDDLKKKKLDDLRDKRLMVLADDRDVQRITVTRADGSRVELIRKGDDKWALTQPLQAPADSGDAATLLSRIKNAEAESFVADAAADLAQYGLDRPRLTAQLTTGNRTLGIRFGKALKDGKVYAAREGSSEVTLVSKFSYEDLDTQAGPKRLRERALVTLERDAIATVELKNAHGSVRLKKSGADAWVRAEEKDPKKAAANVEKVRQVLDRAVGTANAWVEEAPADLARYGLDRPVITLTVTDSRNKTQSLIVGKQAGPDAYYAKGPANAVFEVAKFVFEDLNLKPADFAGAK
jgi:hypothetical protein